MPKFSIDADQRLAILQALEPAEQSAEVELRMLQLNCYACHERDSRGGVGIERRGYFETVAAVDLGDEGRLPPPLDGVGRKLTSNWLKRVFAGKGDIRPHMTIRMPIFGTATELLHAELPLADDTDPNNDPWQGVQPVADAGRQLLDVGCVQCHSIAGEQLPGVIGIDLAHIDQRINPRWFADFLLDPAALKQRTRMPAFFRGGRSSAPDVLAGDVDHQIASIWEYLGNVNKYPLPEKIEQGRVHDFELVPIDQPTLLRTFMREAGPHAIAVGFPEGVHLAFDAERVRIAQFWRGKFLDAHGTWFDRVAPPAVPLGQDVVNVTLARSADHPSHPEFDGYRLSAAGVPTFLYRIGDVEVQDTFRPTEQRGFHRELSFRVPERGEQKKTVAQVLVLSGSKITDDFTNDQGVRMHVMPASTDSNDTRIVNSADGRECYLEHSGSGTIKLRYRW